jgi:hypothetical protein
MNSHFSTSISIFNSHMRLDELDWGKLEIELHKSPRDKKEASTKEGRRLCCVKCGEPITHEDQRIAIQSSHRHTFTNPHGLVFQIGCFSDAPGCAQIGKTTQEWTWFSGYAWQVALCRSCGIHLGWRYRSSDGDGFHGLILDRLVADKTH